MTLDIINLCASYGKTKVLHGVYLASMNPGQFIGLIGPNASGKSTLFKTITGIVSPSVGEIQLGDLDLLKASRKQRSRCVSYMPQAYGCNAMLSVFESVLLALKQTTGWRVTPDNLDQVSQILSLLKLSHLADRGLSMLSGGQAQMVSIAQTMVRKPRLVLLDEPTSALDLHHQLSIMETIRGATRSQNMIVIAALHDLNLAAQFCDRLILMREGRILADDKPSRVLGLDAIGQTYQVRAQLEKTRRGTLYVDAFCNV